MWINYDIAKIDNGYVIKTYESVDKHIAKTEYFCDTLNDALNHIVVAVNNLKKGKTDEHTL